MTTSTLPLSQQEKKKNLGFSEEEGNGDGEVCETDFSLSPRGKKNTL